MPETEAVTLREAENPNAEAEAEAVVLTSAVVLEDCSLLEDRVWESLEELSLV